MNEPFIMGVPASEALALELDDDVAPGTPAAFGETATGSLPPEVGQVFGGAQVYNRDGIRTGEADTPKTYDSIVCWLLAINFLLLVVCLWLAGQ